MSLQTAEQFEENEQYTQAFEEYKRLYEHNPKDLSLLERLGHISLLLDNKEDAAQYYTKILESDATNILAYEQLMDIYVSTDKYKYYVCRGNMHIVDHKTDSLLARCGILQPIVIVNELLLPQSFPVFHGLIRC